MHQYLILRPSAERQGIRWAFHDDRVVVDSLYWTEAHLTR